MNPNDLQEYLYQRGINQTEFAAMVGVDKGTISRWLAGKSRIPKMLDFVVNGMPTMLRDGEE